MGKEVVEIAEKVQDIVPRELSLSRAKWMPNEIKKVLPKEVDVQIPFASPISAGVPNVKRAKDDYKNGLRKGSGYDPYEGFIMPEMPAFNFPDFGSLGFTLPGISQSRPSDTGMLDAIGVRAKKSRGTSSLSNQFNLSASAMGSLKEGARKAGLNLPV
jgi:hypothetical protein